MKLTPKAHVVKHISIHPTMIALEKALQQDIKPDGVFLRVALFSFLTDYGARIYERVSRDDKVRNRRRNTATRRW